MFENSVQNVNDLLIKNNMVLSFKKGFTVSEKEEGVLL